MDIKMSSKLWFIGWRGTLMILTTECALVDIKEENAGGGMPMGGGMPGMM